MPKPPEFLDPERRPQKIKFEIELSNAIFDYRWKTELGLMLIYIGLKIRDSEELSSIIRDRNGNTIGHIVEEH